VLLAGGDGNLVRRKPMSMRVSLWCASPLALLLLAAPARAQVLNSVPLTGPTIQPESATDEEPGEVQTDTAVDMSGEPLDLTTPEPGSNKLRAPGASEQGRHRQAPAVNFRPPTGSRISWWPAQFPINPMGSRGRMSPRPGSTPR
jgi:hypothetical protein